MAWTLLTSEYGGESHYFDVNNGVDYHDLPYLEAPCEHTAPPVKLHPHVRGTPICVSCLIAVGETLPEAMDWHT